MDFTFNQTTGKYLVTLGGVLYDNCTRDTDCPGRAVCAINETWSAIPNMCVCEFAVGHEGATCEDVSSAGWFFYVGHILATLIAAVATCIGLYDLFRMIAWKRFHRDALSTSLVFAILGALFTCIQTGATTRYPIQYVTPDANGDKTDTSAVGRVTIALSFLFSTLAMMNVSLVWIEIAEKAEKLKKSQNNNVEHYRHFLMVYYFFFFGIICIGIIVNDFLIVGGIALPGIIFIIVTYVIGFLKMKKMLLTYMTSEGIASGSGSIGAVANQETLRKMKESMRAIEYTSLGVSICATMFVIWIGIWVISGGFDTRPGRTINLVSLPLAWISVAIGIMVVMWYLHGAITRKGQNITTTERSGSLVGKDYFLKSESRNQTGSFTTNTRINNKMRRDTDLSQDNSATGSINSPKFSIKVSNEPTQPEQESQQPTGNREITNPSQDQDQDNNNTAISTDPSNNA